MKTETEGLIPLPHLLLVISGPSGVGKGTLVKRYLEERPGTFLSISVTTRQPRTCEVNGLQYRFLEIPEFLALREEGHLLEWAEVFHDFYGTPRQPVEAALAAGRDVILEIDVQGGLKIRRSMPEAVLIFVLPPTFPELAQRLISRQTERREQIEFRLQTARLELRSLPYYDYYLVNDDLEEALRSLQAIVEAERHRTSRIPTGQEGAWLR